VHFPVTSNATDFTRLAWADWIAAPVANAYDVVILPGTKDTLGALAWLRDRGLDAWVRRQHAQGATILGVCGGFQILGDVVRDPDGVESRAGSAPGLGLLPVETVLVREKVTAVRRARTPAGALFDAYEIHVGVTTAREPVSPFAYLDDGSPEGARRGRVCGTYLHGALDDARVCEEILGVTLPSRAPNASTYEALADWFEASLNPPADWLPLRR
jgi:adenosylcobyric acid synthase